MSCTPRVLRHLAVLLGTTALVSTAVTEALAGNVVWSGTNSTDWQVGGVNGNWSGAAVPGTTDSVIIDTTTPNPAILSHGTGNTGSLYVGEVGSGSLTLDSGVGLTSSASSAIADQSSSTGVVTVRGSASWLLSGIALLDVGKFGNGTLHISNGALVSATNVTIGSQTGSTGLVTVDGVNSKLSVAGTLTVGNNSTGTLALTKGGQALAGNALVLGYAVGVTATATVDGANSWLSANNVTVGAAGTGTVTVSNGGTLGAGNILGLGFASTGNGTVTVTGAGSKVQAGSGGTGSLVIGDSGTGTLNVTSGGAGTVSGAVTLANTANATGTLNVSGSGSSFTVAKVSGNGGGLYDGSLGNGSVNVSNSAALTADQIFVGSQAGSQGTFNVQSGATATAATAFDLGSNANSTGTATVTGTGSSLTTSALTVGDSGTGTLNIQNGGHVTANGLALVGSVAGSQGAITVDGAGSLLTVNNNFYIGLHGIGSVTVSNGGQVMNATNNGIIGFDANGSVTVTGAGSSFAVSGNFVQVGGDGNGVLNVLAGGSFTAHHLLLGNGTGTTTATVDGAGSAIHAFSVIVGDSNVSSAVAALFVTNGGAVTNGVGALGYNTGSFGFASISGPGSSWTNTTGLTIGQFGSGTLAVANGGTVSSTSAVQIAQQSGSLGVLAIGSASTIAAAPGTLNAPGIQFGAGNGFLEFNHTSTAYDFSIPIAGTGHISQAAGHTILSGNDSGFTGVVEVFGGTLSVNTNLAGGAATVYNHGVLGGSGTIGSLQLQSTGILAPGNSIGTLTVTGNATFASGSLYQVQLDGQGHADKLVVGGDATIFGGTVQALAMPGAYFGVNRYTILTSTGGVTGTFAGVTSNAAFLTPSLSYDANDVYLTMTRNAASFASVGGTRNQVATGTAIDAAGFGNPLWNAVVPLTAAQARNAFDQMSGEIHGSTRATLVEDSRFLRDAAIDRLRDAFRAAGTSGSPAMAYASMEKAPAAPDAAFAVWGRAIGSWGQTSSDGNAAAVSHNTAGIISGVDALISDYTRLGVLAGYTRTNLDSAATSSTAGSDNFHVGAYSGSQWGALGLSAGAAYSFNRIDATRSVAFPGFADHLTSAYDAGTFQAFGDLGYRINVAPKATIEPFAGIAYVGLHSNAFTESGGVAALAGQGATTNVTFSTLGLRSAVGFDLGGMAATWKGSLGWRHAFGDVTPLATFAFAGGSPFTVAGVPVARDAAAVDAGFNVAIARGVTFGIAYTGQLAQGFQDNGVKADLDWRF